MVVGIRDLLEEAPRSFSGSVDLSGLRLWGETPFPQPVAVEGSLFLRHGRVRVDYTVGYTLSGACARCLAPIRREGRAGFSHPVEEAPGEDAAVIAAPNGQLDLGELAGADLLLTLDRPLLCKGDCKGLCPACGADLNVTECDCLGQKKVDPRFAALLDLL